MKTVAIIPARYQSTRFPGKPLALIAGKPMIQRVYERAVSSPHLSETLVATDDERIRDCVLDFGGKVCMTRSDHTSGTDRVCEAAIEMGHGPQDVIVNIQGDQPIFEPQIISSLVEPFGDDPSVVMTTLKWKMPNAADALNRNHVKVVVDNQDFAIYFSRSPIPCYRDSDSAAVFYKHLGFYGYKMAFLERFMRLGQGTLEFAEKLEQLRALEHGFKIKVTEIPYNAIEVDVPEDIIRVEAALKGTG
jgi:3-deoxy-manno-octulosonate cytidylyltransferase (CMP-KDO synthetase)